MKTLIAFTVRVTTPFKLDNGDLIVAGHAESLAETIKQVVKDEMAPYDITGLAVEVKERK